MHSQVAANGITTLLLLVIGGIGMWRGLKELEAVEKYAVAFNLGMIGALLVSLAIYNVNMVLGGTWALPSISWVIDFHDLRVLLGLLIVVPLSLCRRRFTSCLSVWRRCSFMTVWAPT